MNNTLIENLNALMTIKKELNKVLVDNEQPGGPVFDTYPEQFRELFRVLEDKLDDIEEGPYATYEPETVVAKPVIGFENNVVTITCATQGAEIYINIKDIYGYERSGETYNTRFSISRDTWIETYAILNGVRSSQPDNSRWCYYQAGGAVPAPEFDRTNGIVTITCRQQGAQIWWRIMPSTTFVLYTGPELVDGTKWLEAYAVYQGKGSETAISEGTEEGIMVEDPVLTCTDNVVTITCATEDAVIWYKTNLDDEWTEYTEPIEISVDTEFTAYAYKEGNISNTVTESFEYEEPYVPPVIVPADPVISCSNNVVTITCSTSGATIYYSTDNGVTYNVYSGTITISADTTFYAYSELNGETSNTVSYEAEYEEPQPDAPNIPVISCNANVITITCSTTGATIYYSTDNGITYNSYSTAITVDPSLLENEYVTIYAYSSKSNVTSGIAQRRFKFPINTPVISINNNGVVTITGGEGINEFPYYKINNGNWTKYTGTFTVSDNDTIYAKLVFESDGNYGPEVSETYIYIDYSIVPFTIKVLEDGHIYWRASGINVRETIEYKKNDGEWTSITAASGTNSSSNTITVTNGDIVQFRGDNDTYYAVQNYNYFRSDCNCNIYGNIMSLIDSVNYSSINELTAARTFYRIFGDNNTRLHIINAENLVLPATTLTDYCYYEMFAYNTTLVKAPLILPATTLANNCYEFMFYKCSSLTTTPELPATSLISRCYSSMFGYCTSLTITPALPATTLVANCYSNMFEYCTSLTTVTSLPATTLAEYCYRGMFYGCTSLTTVPAILPTTTLAKYCCSMMFYGCTSLTTAPSLPATTLVQHCYEYMFEGCTSLINTPATLPATTLAINCYERMFKGCSSLTTAPILPATVLTANCYKWMFSNCSSLNYIKCLATDLSMSSGTDTWVSGVAVSGTFVKKTGVSWPTGSSGIPTNWTVQEASS